METIIRNSLAFSRLPVLLFIFFFVTVSNASAVDTCSEGTGVPPFLSSGANPNLLMVIDNSGSMLDPAYLDDDGVTVSVDNRGDQSCVVEPEDEQNPTACMDESYLVDPAQSTCDATTHEGQFVLDPGKIYTGYFARDSYYSWQEAALPSQADGDAITIRSFDSTICYADGDLVMNNSVLYQAECRIPNCLLGAASASNDGCNPSAINLVEDNKDDVGTSWVPYIDFTEWLPDRVWDPDTFVSYDKQLYYTQTGGDDTLSGAESPIDNASVTAWTPVNHTWLPGHSYDSGEIVTYEGMLFFNSSGATFTTSSTSLYDDTVTVAGSSVLRWQRIGDSYFQEVASLGDVLAGSSQLPCQAPSFSYTHSDAVGNTITDMQVTMVNMDGNVVTSADIVQAQALRDDLNEELAKQNPDPVVVQDLVDRRNALLPSSVTCFAATGNFLNWAASSKFDIQKEILTGGKLNKGEESCDPTAINPASYGTEAEYNAAVEACMQGNNEDDRLVMENRGCAGKDFVKQITVDAANNIQMTMRVRGSSLGDWLGTNDDTTRIDIFAVTVGGYDDTQCRLAIELMENDGSLPDIRAALEQCMYADNQPTSEHDAKTKQIYFAAVHNCVKQNWNKGGELGTFCQDLYLGEQGFIQTYPWEVTPWDPEYVCYGMYTDTAYPYSDGLGYIGRLWREWLVQGSGDTCVNTCDCSDSRWTAGSGYCVDEIQKNQEELRCESGQMYRCTKHGGTWTCESYYEDTVTNTTCTPSGNIHNMCNDIPDNLVRDSYCWVPENQPSDRTWELALRDYCGDLAVPEVIDPSDVVSTATTNSGNIPASLIDSGIYDQLGQGQAIATMKGYIKWVVPAEQIVEQTDTLTQSRPVGPRGIFYDVAGELRLGIMAFKDNGSKTECETLEATCGAKTDNIFNVCDATNSAYDATACEYCEARMSIDKFCPPNNGDGAKVLANIELSMYTDNLGTLNDASDDVEVWDHYRIVMDGINAARANAWTPLAEAEYTAIGYYGQNSAQRLSPNTESPDDYDFRTQAEIPVYNGGGNTTYAPGDLVEYPSGSGDYYQTSVGGLAVSSAGPKDDTNIFWSQISTLDPINHWCQDNHILIITEGASTADVNRQVIDFVNASSSANNNQDPPQAMGSDPDTATDTICTDGLEGSTYLDDLTYIARQADPAYLYTVPQYDGLNKRNIFTHLVTTGSLRSDGTGECSPRTIMENAATNGGSTLFTGENPDELEDNLRAVLTSILSRASAGSAASVISNSRTGSGAVYQAIFWPDLVDSTTQTRVQWVGDVHALLLDKFGALYEDTNQDGKLEPSEDLNNSGTVDQATDIDINGNPEDIDNNGVDSGADKRIIFYYSDNANRTRACLNVTYYFTHNLTCPDDPALTDCSSTEDCRELTDIQYLWSAARWLADANDAGITTNRAVYMSDADNRYIYTWEDLNNNGIVDHSPEEWLPFTAAALFPAGGLDVTPDGGSDPFGNAYPARGTVADDFAFTSQLDIDALVSGAAAKEDAAKAVVDWVRGQDQLNDESSDLNGNGRLDKRLRYRQYPVQGVEKTWRLGDIIHSTPTVVGQPAEAFQYIYKDPTYALFTRKYQSRRQMVYYGANDGMLHAANGGFYNEATQSFCKTLNPAYRDDPVSEPPCLDSGPDLGAEMWAYVPYNLIPHLKCLPERRYDHKYYVDQRPRIFDVQIFADDCAYSGGEANCTNAVHPGGWGTILVGSMRFGGAPIDAVDIDSSAANDNRRFVSAFFVLDITDPENPPELLGEMTTTTDLDGTALPDGTITTRFADMAYTTSSPTMVVMRENTGATKWYLIMGSGPNSLKGENNNPGQRAKIAVLPLSWLMGSTTNWSTESGSLYTPKDINTATRRAFRIPNRQPGTLAHQNGSEGGTYWVPGTENSFVSDLINVDYDVESAAQVGIGGLYRVDAVYFGTVDGESFTGIDGATWWNGGGRMYRMVTKRIAGDQEVASTPSQWNDTGWQDSSQYNWYTPHRMLIDAKMPITAAPSVGWDGKSFWVYFGTGRFFDKKDKSDDRINRFFGIREPFDLSGLTCNDRRLSWATVDWWDNLNNTPIDLNSLNHNGLQGLRGLLQVDNIIVSELASSRFANIAYLECSHCVEEDITVDGDGYDCTSLPADSCFPADLTSVTATDNSVDPAVSVSTYLFNDLRRYIAGNSCDTGLDGWFRETHEDRERHVGQAALLGGLLTYTGYQPHDDLCQAEGVSYLYGVHFQTGTAWYENVFGLFNNNNQNYVKDKLSLGRGLATAPSIQVGSGPNDANAYIQTSTGEIIEVGQENLPFDRPVSKRIGWGDDTN